MVKQMKESGLEWAGLVPEKWTALRLKDYYAFEKGKNAALYTQSYIDEHSGEYPVFSGQTENNGVMGTIDSFDYDIEECLFTTTVGAKVMTPKIIHGKFSLSQNCLIMKQTKKCCNPFIYYALFPLFAYEKSLIPSYMQPSLRVLDLKKYVIFAPRYEEQIRIAAFLEKECSHIDSVIEQTQSSIEEYKKLKQAVITQAVTKGIRPNRPMKDSGIDWIVQIPEEWDVLRGKWLFHETDERSEDGSEELLTVSHITGVTPRSQKNVNMFMSESLVGYKICRVNDIAANTMWMWQGAIGVSKYHGVISPSYNTYRQTNNQYNPDYLDYLLRIRPLVETYNANSTGITASRLRLYPDQFLSIIFPVPPMEEQVEIAAYLNEKIGDVEKLVVKKERYLSELENFKKSMIFEYVTGKKEVQ